jgi:hypothetical protein
MKRGNLLERLGKADVEASVGFLGGWPPVMVFDGTVALPDGRDESAARNGEIA